MRSEAARSLALFAHLTLDPTSGSATEEADQAKRAGRTGGAAAVRRG